jgi:hypothetical protein
LLTQRLRIINENIRLYCLIDLQSPVRFQISFEVRYWFHRFIIICVSFVIIVIKVIVNVNVDISSRKTSSDIRLTLKMDGYCKTKINKHIMKTREEQTLISITLTADRSRVSERMTGTVVAVVCKVPSLSIPLVVAAAVVAHH